MSRIRFFLGYGFMLFWTLLVSVFWIPVCFLLWRDRRLFRGYMRSIAIGVIPAAGIRLTIEGEEKIDPKAIYVFVANHQSGIETVLFPQVRMGPTVTVGKKELLRVPLLGLIYYAMGNVIIDRKKGSQSLGTLTRVGEEMKADRFSIWMFPEGTRNRSGVGLLPFKRGAFIVAAESGIPILPVVASPLLPLFNFKRCTLNPGRVHIQVLDPVVIQSADPEALEQVMQQVREAMLAALSAGALLVQSK